MESRTNNAKRNIATGLFSKLILTALPFLVRTVIIQELGVLYLGLNSLFTSIFQVINLAELGFGESIVFSMYKPLAENDEKKVKALLNLYKKTYTIIGSSIFTIGVAITPFIPKLINGEVPAEVNIYILYVLNLAQSALSYFLYSYKISLLIALQRSDINNLVGLVSYSAQYILQIVILKIFHNFYLYFIIGIIRIIINNLVINHITRTKYPQIYCEGKIDEGELKDIKKRVAGLFIFKVSGVLRSSFDSIVLSASLGLAILAKYQNYLYVITAVSSFVNILCNSITASVGNSITLETTSKNYNDFKKFFCIYMWIVCICTTCIHCMLQPFIELWVGKDLMLSDNIRNLFSMYFFTGQMGMMCYVYRQASGIWWQDKIRPIIEGVINLILNFIFVRLIGVAGVMLSTILCLVFSDCIWGSWALFNFYFKKFSNKIYLIKVVLYGCVTFASCYFAGSICSLITGSLLVSLVLNCLISVLVGFFLFGIMALFTKDGKEAIAFVKRILTSIMIKG